MYDTQRRLASIIAVTVGLGFVLGVLVNQLWKHNGLAVEKSANQKVMGTFAQITAVAADSNTAHKAIAAGFGELYRVERLMSYHDANSEVSAVNRQAFSEPVRVSGDTFAVVAEAVKWYRLSGGSFDVTVGPLVDLWKKAGKTNQMPDVNAIALAESKVGSDKLILDANQFTIKFKVDGMRIDLGAIAKGYSVDLAVAAMKKAGAKGGLVVAGGDLRTFGVAPKGRGFWNVGLQDPCGAEIEVDKILYTLKIKDKAVTTSGNYFRYAKVGQTHVSHIIDPKTGTGAARFASVTIIADTALKADALSTAVSVMKPPAGIKLVEESECAAILIGTAPDYVKTYSSKARKYISNKALDNSKETKESK